MIIFKVIFCCSWTTAINGLVSTCDTPAGGKGEHREGQVGRPQCSQSDQRLSSVQRQAVNVDWTLQMNLLLSDIVIWTNQVINIPLIFYELLNLFLNTLSSGISLDTLTALSKPFGFDISHPFSWPLPSSKLT